MTTGRINQVTTLKAKCQPPRGGRGHYHAATKVATRSVPLFKGTVCPIGTNFGAQRRLPQSRCTDAKLCGAILTGNCRGRTASHDHDGFPIDSTEFWPKAINPQNSHRSGRRSTAHVPELERFVVDRKHKANAADRTYRDTRVGLKLLTGFFKIHPKDVPCPN